jgi:hypothetical protein
MKKVRLSVYAKPILLKRGAVETGTRKDSVVYPMAAPALRMLAAKAAVAELRDGNAMPAAPVDRAISTRSLNRLQFVRKKPQGYCIYFPKSTVNM